MLRGMKDIMSRVMLDKKASPATKVRNCFLAFASFLAQSAMLLCREFRTW